MTSITKDVNLLNEKGIQILELKKVLLDNQSNPLICDTLLSSVKESDYEKNILEALISENVTIVELERILIRSSLHVNKRVLEKTFTDFQSKLTSNLSAKGQKHFTTKIDLKHGGVIVLRKFGINLAKMQREFKISEKEALDLYNNGFMKQFATLKLNAFAKDLVENIKKSTKFGDFLHFNTDLPYFNEEYMIYNIDFTITLVLTEQHLAAKNPAIAKIAEEIMKLLTVVENEYYRTVRGE